MTLLKANILGLLGVAVAACGGSDASMMSDYTQDLGRHLDAVQTEQSAHSSEVAAFSELDLIGRAEDDHWRRMDDHMSQMDMATGHMMSCADNRGGHFDPALFAGMVHDLRSDCDGHRAVMRGAATLDVARTEESRHQDAMRDRLDEMRGQMGTMMGQASAYTCPHGM